MIFKGQHRDRKRQHKSQFCFKTRIIFVHDGVVDWLYAFGPNIFDKIIF